MKIVFFETDQTSAQAFQEVFASAHVVCFEEPLDDQVPENIQDAQVISIFICSKITKNILSQFPQLQFIITRSTGFDHIDIQEAQKRGITVCYLPAYASIAVAEYTFGLLLMLTRKLYKACYQVKHEHDFSRLGLQGISFAEKILGVVGTGNIGKKVVAIARGLNMHIIAYDVCPDEKFAHQYQFSYSSFTDLLSAADIITFHVPLNEQTKYMLNEGSMALLKKGVYIINTARADVIDMHALCSFLDAGIIAGIAVDVLSKECLMKEYQKITNLDQYTGVQAREVLVNEYLLAHDRVLISPHNAFNSKESINIQIRETIRGIKEWQRGKPICKVPDNQICD